MKIKTFIIDAFTDEPFKGNPAGVCLLDEPLSDNQMQSIATEMNLSETAFLLRDKTDSTKYSVRYFTPTVEIAFCGHATLASSKLILTKFDIPSVEFTTGHNLKLSAAKFGNQVNMKFPLYNTIEYDPGKALYEATGISNPLATRFSTDLKTLMIEVDSKETLIAITPNFEKMSQSTSAMIEVIVTAKSADSEYDFYSRCFCPWVGINEDPVTGAAHTILAKYWGDKLSKTEMTAFQASKRGGFMKLKITGKAELEILSDAQIILEGEFNLSDERRITK